MRIIVEQKKEVIKLSTDEYAIYRSARREIDSHQYGMRAVLVENTIMTFKITNLSQQQAVRNLDAGALQAYRLGRRDVDSHVHGMLAVHGAWC